MSQRSQLLQGVHCLDTLRALIDNEYENKVYLTGRLLEIQFELKKQIDCLPDALCDI